MTGTFMGGMRYNYNLTAAWADTAVPPLFHTFFFNNNFTWTLSNLTKMATVTIETDRSPLVRGMGLPNVYNSVSLSCASIIWYLNVAGSVKIDDSFSNTVMVTDNLFLATTRRDLS